MAADAQMYVQTDGRIVVKQDGYRPDPDQFSYHPVKDGGGWGDYYPGDVRAPVFDKFYLPEGFFPSPSITLDNTRQLGIAPLEARRVDYGS